MACHRQTLPRRGARWGLLPQNQGLHGSPWGRGVLEQCTRWPLDATRGDMAWRRREARTPPAQPSTRPGACVFQEFADSVSQLVTQKFHELTVGLASVHARHKALAGIVMTTGNASCFSCGIPSARTGDSAPA